METSKTWIRCVGKDNLEERSLLLFPVNRILYAISQGEQTIVYLNDEKESCLTLELSMFEFSELLGEKNND